jgi:hypothetical protein
MVRQNKSLLIISYIKTMFLTEYFAVHLQLDIDDENHFLSWKHGASETKDSSKAYKQPLVWANFSNFVK